MIDALGRQSPLPPGNTKRIRFKSSPEAHQVAVLSGELGIRPALSSLLVQRGITNFHDAKAYFRPSLEDLHDPFLMKHMRKAVDRLVHAFTHQESILVYGDYDVDGVTSVAMFYQFLKSMGARVDFYIPDRYDEGYGISMKAIQWASDAGFSLIVSLDCGIRAVRCVQQAKTLGIDTIVSDHHEPGDVLPAAHAIINPKQPGCTYPHMHLSGCGVGFKLLQALVQHPTLSAFIAHSRDYLDLVAISIACDIVPVVGENRILAYHGLRQINTTPRPGIKALMQLGNIRPPLCISQLVFGLGPRINAAGRVGRAHLAVRLLLAKDDEEAMHLAHELDQKNKTRRTIDSRMTEEAISMIRDHPHKDHAKTTVLFKENWHKGVVGIVAARCVEQYYRPTIVLTAAHGKATGSARSVAGYDIHQALSACADLLDQYGGHAHAAGVTLPLDRVTAFKERFEEEVARSITEELLTPVQEVDLPLCFSEIDAAFYKVLKQMSPFGVGNTKAVFATSHVLTKYYQVLKKQHLKLYVHQEGCTRVLEAIGFGLAYHEPLVRASEPYRMFYTIEENHYLGVGRLQLNIKELQAM